VWSGDSPMGPCHSCRTVERRMALGGNRGAMEIGGSRADHSHTPGSLQLICLCFQEYWKGREWYIFLYQVHLIVSGVIAAGQPTTLHLPALLYRACFRFARCRILSGWALRCASGGSHSTTAHHRDHQVHGRRLSGKGGRENHPMKRFH